MEPFDQEILRPRKRKWALVLLACATFVAIGLMMLRDPNENRGLTLFFLGFFGLGGVVAVMQFVPGSSFLQLTPEGFTMRTMWRSQFYRWSDIEQFGIAEVHSGGQLHTLVGFDFSESYPGEGMRMRNLNRRLSGFEASLPDNYGWKHGDLAAHLNTLKSRFTGR